MPTIHFELIIKGNEDLLCAYLKGFLNGKKIKQGVIFSKECRLETHHLKEFIHYHGEVVHLICRAGLRATVASAIVNAPKEYSFELKKEQQISSASFEFKFETFSRKVAGGIKRAFTNIPTGLKLQRYKPKEEIDPKAFGVERYAPAHDYRFVGEGKVIGDIETILYFYNKLRRNEFIKLEDILLSY